MIRFLRSIRKLSWWPQERLAPKALPKDSTQDPQFQGQTIAFLSDTQLCLNWPRVLRIACSLTGLSRIS
jgi:hypothetical protein